MKTIVITGSTRGIGYGLAEAFLDLQCAVVISGRTAEAVEEAVVELSSRYDPQRIAGAPCDVTDLSQVEALWAAAVDRFGGVDVWINNAGIAHAQSDLAELPAERAAAVIRTNVVGAIYGAQVALRGMLAQGYGQLYNMEGLGSGGRHVEGLAVYGASKRALAYLTDALVKETRGTPVVVGALRPGMVLTDMLTEQRGGRAEDWEAAKRIFNILADRVETVAPWLARRVLENERSGVRIRWLTTWKTLGRFLSAPFRRRDLFAEEA